MELTTPADPKQLETFAGMNPEYAQQNGAGKDAREVQMSGTWASLLEILEHSEHFEALRTFKVDDLDVWPIVKATLVMEALNRDQRTHFVQTAAKPWTEWPKLASGLLTPHLNSAKALFLANSAPAFRQNGILLNPHLDPLRHHLEEQGIRTLAAYYDISSVQDAAFPSIGLAGHLQLSRFSRLTPNASQELSACSAELSLAIRRTNIGSAQSHANVSRRISATIRLRSRFRSIFASNPDLKLVFTTNYYGPNGWAACAAAKILGLRTIDIQHGLQGRFHHAYSWPEIHARTLGPIPDHFLTWTEDDAANLDRYPLTAGKATLIGPSHFQLERLLRDHAGTNPLLAKACLDYCTAAAALTELAGRTRQEGKKVAGLFLQYKEDDRWLQELRRRLPDNIALWVRRHPGVRQLNPDPPSITGLTFVDDYPLPSILGNVDVTVTGYSSVGIEAAHVGCPVVAYSPLAKEFLETACKSTGFTLCESDIDAIASAMATALKTPVSKSKLKQALPLMTNILSELGMDEKAPPRSDSLTISAEAIDEPQNIVVQPDEGFLPNLDGLDVDVVMLVANDGWDVRALKQARSLASNGVSVAVVGREADPFARNRFKDAHGVDIVTVPRVLNGTRMQLLLENGVWQRLNFRERLLAWSVQKILFWTDFKVKAKVLPPPVHATFLETLQRRAEPRARPVSSNESLWLTDLLHSFDASREKVSAKIARRFGRSPLGLLLGSVVRAAGLVLSRFLRFIIRCDRYLSIRIRYIWIRALRKISSNSSSVALPFRKVALKWYGVGRKVFNYSHYFLRTLEYGETVARLRPRVIHAHDLYTLQAAVRIAAWTGAKVVYDAHELEADRTKMTDMRLKRWIIDQEKFYAPKTDACITVSNAIADEMVKELGIERPTIVFNAPVTDHLPEEWRGKTIRKTLGLDPQTPLFVFVGKVYELFNSNQRVGMIIEALAQCEGFHLAIMGPLGSTAAEQIPELSARLGIEGRLHILGSIPAEAITSYIADADAGIYFMWPDTRNIDLTIPNKLFEFSLAGLPIVVSDLTSTRWFVEQVHNAILVSEESPEAIAKACREAYETRDKLRPSPDRLAFMINEFSWSAQERKLLALYGKLLDAPPNQQRH
ncbi:glycosyltransferase family 4 protein [Microvirga makkahensis]|uniref:Glycosyltransferase n=1 Tax=Microvirga makkahensis TaxID=1128670 RepID=A0A7X3MTV4_9HYPH|nr:glycosyltransferase family 4 protein [Microvirga makkahensis]MXQ12895.1 glycosyltransferase [Microvirga makkahensis]